MIKYDFLTEFTFHWILQLPILKHIWKPSKIQFFPKTEKNLRNLLPIIDIICMDSTSFLPSNKKYPRIRKFTYSSILSHASTQNK